MPRRESLRLTAPQTMGQLAVGHNQANTNLASLGQQK